MARTPGPRRLKSCALLLSAFSARLIAFPETKVRHLPTCCRVLFPADPQAPSFFPQAEGPAQQRSWRQPSGKGFQFPLPVLESIPLHSVGSIFSLHLSSSVFLTLSIYSSLLNPPSPHPCFKHGISKSSIRECESQVPGWSTVSVAHFAVGVLHLHK